jgi:hypothetical protein
MTDGEREIDNEIKADAARDQSAWPLVECEYCGLRFIGDFGDLDAHQEQDCDDGLYDEDEDAEEAA